MFSRFFFNIANYEKIIYLKYLFCLLVFLVIRMSEFTQQIVIQSINFVTKIWTKIIMTQNNFEISTLSIKR